MKCPNCGGKGKYKNGFGKVGICYYCLGTGKVNDKGEQVRTHEEWFCQLNTEKKAKIIKMVINICILCKEHGTVRTRGCLLRQNMAKGLLFLPCMDEDGIVKWLKQPHGGES